MKFALIGDGKQAQYHRKAIAHVGGDIVWVHDPRYGTEYGIQDVDYAVICSPGDCHRAQTIDALKIFASNVIVEKPLCMPWEPIPEDDNINVVLQLRYLDLPETADLVSVIMIRDNGYFHTWKGDPRKTGGVFFNLFVHYIDLAMRLEADFEGMVCHEGKQSRMVDDTDILHVDMQECYNRMYEAIMDGKGVKPSELFYLHYIMDKVSRDNGFGKNLIGKNILIPRELM